MPRVRSLLGSTHVSHFEVFSRSIVVATLGVMMAGTAACGSSGALRPEAPPAPTVSRLGVEAPSGADVRVDGVLVGVAPLASAITASPGPHAIVVSETGHETVGQRVVLAPGKSRTVAIELAETTQRTWAWITFGASAAGVSTGVVFGVLAVVEERKARDLVQRGSGAVSAAEETAYNDALAAGSTYRVGAGIAAGAGLGLFVTGALLYAFDEPVLERSDTSAPPPPVAVIPILAPDLVGVSAQIVY